MSIWRISVWLECLFYGIVFVIVKRERKIMVVREGIRCSIDFIEGFFFIDLFRCEEKIWEKRFGDVRELISCFSFSWGSSFGGYLEIRRWLLSWKNWGEVRMVLVEKILLGWGLKVIYDIYFGWNENRWGVLRRRVCYRFMVVL